MTSSDGSHSTVELGDLVSQMIEDPVKRTPGVGSINTFGSGYAMRIWLEPMKMAQYQVTPADVTAAVSQQNTNVTVGVEGGLHRRAVEVDAAVRLLGGQLLDQHGQATRCGVGLGLGKAQAGVLQALLDTSAEGFGQLGERLRWQFFGTQFNQEILGAHYSASFSLARTSSRSSGVAIGKPSLARASR